MQMYMYMYTTTQGTLGRDNETTKEAQWQHTNIMQPLWLKPGPCVAGPVHHENPKNTESPPKHQKSQEKAERPGGKP
eukprot:1256604-Alexandrium_andersonii.AAC.1